MAGIYLHIPFCKKACYYCDFHFSTSLKYKDQMLEAIRRELKLRRDYLAGQTIETIYFGGGTPSVLEAAEIRSLLDSITSDFSVSSSAEITMEANPDDLSAQKVKELKGTSINRFSIGTQSFFDEDLIWMNRAHTAGEAKDSIRRVQDAGFENITIDLIYGFPLLSDVKWKSNIREAIELEVPHISSYSMTVEQGTALHHFIRKGKQVPISDGQSAEQFMLLMEDLESAGFEHYEISNFSRPGMNSRHNSNYWNGVPYLGAGPSAHSFDGETRQWNISDNAKYLDSLQHDRIPSELERLTISDRINEYIMTSLRTRWGLDLIRVEAEFGTDYRSIIESCLQEFIDKDQIRNVDNKIILTRNGKLFADHIAAQLFVEPAHPDQY
jgi:oxygen-independent coproporphyrinogen III oxidase